MAAFANRINRRLTAEHQGCKGQGSQRCGSEFHVKVADGQDSAAEGQLE